MTTPELPAPDGTAEVIVGSEKVGRMIADVVEYRDAWSEAKVRAYGEARFLAGMERAAVIAESERLNDPLDCPEDEAYEMAITDCAAAIRAEAAKEAK